MSKVVDRIRKLLTLANDEGAAPNEQEVARLLAEKMMEAAGLDESDLAPNEDPVATVAKQEGDYAGSRWTRILATSVGFVTGCEHYLYGNMLQWIGTIDQRSKSIELHRWLMATVEKMAQTALKNADVPQWHRRAFSNSYRLGVAVSIFNNAKRIMESRKDTRTPMEQQAALVLKSRVDDAVKVLIPKLKKNYYKGGISSDVGFASGRFDDNNVELQSKVTTPDHRRLK